MVKLLALALLIIGGGTTAYVLYKTVLALMNKTQA